MKTLKDIRKFTEESTPFISRDFKNVLSDN